MLTRMAPLLTRMARMLTRMTRWLEYYTHSIPHRVNYFTCICLHNIFIWKP